MMIDVVWGQKSELNDMLVEFEGKGFLAFVNVLRLVELIQVNTSSEAGQAATEMNMWFYNFEGFKTHLERLSRLNSLAQQLKRI